MCEGLLPGCSSERLQHTAVKESRWPRNGSVHPAHVQVSKVPYLQVNVCRVWKLAIPMQSPRRL